MNLLGPTFIVQHQKLKYTVHTIGQSEMYTSTTKGRVISHINPIVFLIVNGLTLKRKTCYCLMTFTECASNLSQGV